MVIMAIAGCYHLLFAQLHALVDTVTPVSTVNMYYIRQHYFIAIEFQFLRVSFSLDFSFSRFQFILPQFLRIQFTSSTTCDNRLLQGNT